MPGVSELSFLLALTAYIAADEDPLPSWQKSHYPALRRKLAALPDGSPPPPRQGSVRTVTERADFRTLRTIAGLGPDNRVMRNSLSILESVRVLDRDPETGEPRDLALLAADAGSSGFGRHLSFALHPTLAAAALEGALKSRDDYARPCAEPLKGRAVAVPLDEHRELPGGAKLLHAAMCGMVSPGRNAVLGIDRLASEVFGRSPAEGRARRTRRERVRCQLARLGMLDTWTVCLNHGTPDAALVCRSQPGKAWKFPYGKPKLTLVRFSG
jgi:hypothetical protein